MLYNADGDLAPDAVWSTATYNEGKNPCSLIVSSADGGSVAVVDSTGAQLFKQPPMAPITPKGILAAGQQLQQVCSMICPPDKQYVNVWRSWRAPTFWSVQGVPLYSSDTLVFLLVQGDGNVVLYALSLLKFL